MADAPITAQALFGLGVFQQQELSLLWIAADVREMERLHESIHTLVDATSPSHTPRKKSDEDVDSTIHLFQPMEKDPAVFGEHLKLVYQILNICQVFFLLSLFFNSPHED